MSDVFKWTFFRFKLKLTIPKQQGFPASRAVAPVLPHTSFYVFLINFVWLNLWIKVPILKFLQNGPNASISRSLSCNNHSLPKPLCTWLSQYNYTAMDTGGQQWTLRLRKGRVSCACQVLTPFLALKPACGVIWEKVQSVLQTWPSQEMEIPTSCSSCL